MTHSVPTRRSSDLAISFPGWNACAADCLLAERHQGEGRDSTSVPTHHRHQPHHIGGSGRDGTEMRRRRFPTADRRHKYGLYRSDEHTSELQSLMRTSYAAFCWQKHNTHDYK